MKKKILGMLLCPALVLMPLSSHAESMEDYQRETAALYETGKGSHDGATTAIGASMMAWGIGLAVGIMILVAVIKSSDG